MGGKKHITISPRQLTSHKPAHTTKKPDRKANGDPQEGTKKGSQIKLERVLMTGGARTLKVHPHRHFWGVKEGHSPRLRNEQWAGQNDQTKKKKKKTEG